MFINYTQSPCGQTTLRSLLVVLCASFAAPEASATEVRELAPGRILEVHYEGFTVWLDCARHGAFRFEYLATKDAGSEPRSPTFVIDPDVPAECQQTSASAYSTSAGNYDRGHQVPANHLDASPIAIRQSNFMTNILPQAAAMNRGAWLATEEIIECYRDIKDLHVTGGTIWGFNPHDDYFLASHGVPTPDYFWKVVIATDDAIAWIVPNTEHAKKNMLDQYIVPIATIERLLGEDFDVPAPLKTKHPTHSWTLPQGCDKG